MTSDRTPTVFFHVGAPKTGTTFLQSLLWRERDRLRADGVLYPGANRDAHFEACLDLRRMTFLGFRPSRVAGAWRSLVDEVRAWGGPAVIDHELFASAAGEHIAQALADLAFADVQVLYTVRDMARQLPAAWQERMKNRSTISYAEFLRRVRVTAGRPRRASFWRLHDAPALLRRWAAHLPPERITVVTVPPPGSDRDELWRRFAGVLGVPAASYDTSVAMPNESIGAVDAALLRRLNERLGRADVPWPVYSFVVKQRLAQLLAKRRSPRIGLPQDVHDWAVAWAEAEVAALHAGGYRVVGDLADLVPGAWKPGADPDTAVPGRVALAGARVAAAVLRASARGR